MTLIVAADVQDHLILAGDHCALLSGLSNQGPPVRIPFNYRKLHPWKHGAIAASGDVPLMTYFMRLLAHYLAKGQAIPLAEIARQAKALCTGHGASRAQSTGNIFLTLPGEQGFRLHQLAIGESLITVELIHPIGTHFSLREEAALDEAAYHAINGQLRPAFFFENVQAFHAHHIERLCALYAQQSAADPFVTSSFDLCILDKRTGEHWFWQMPSVATDRQWVTISLSGELEHAARMTQRQ